MRPFWFVYDRTLFSGRPKAEAAVMAYAAEKYLYCVIEEDKLVDVIDDLKAFHDKVLKENKRLAPVDISKTDKRNIFDGNMSIYIGQQGLRLRKVKDFIELEL